MKFVFTFAVACVLSAIPTAQLPSGRQEPFVPMAVSYRADLARNRERAASDFDAIRTLGFNAIRLVVSWADLEPTRGQYRLDVIDSALELAGRSNLKVILRLELAQPPAWLFDRYPDGRYVPAEGSSRAGAARGCLDHPGVRADAEAFVAAVTAKAAGHAAFNAIDVGSDFDSGFCVCPNTARRYQEWTKATFSGAARSEAQRRGDQARFVLITRRDHLAIVAAATSARGNHMLTSSAAVPSLLHAPERPAEQDDWAMADVVDRYGVTVPPPHTRASELTPALLALGFDGLRGAAGPHGWLVVIDDDTSAADLRLWTWTAVSRGARGVVYGDWRTDESKQAAALAGSDVRAIELAQTAAGMARVIGRNPALFAPLRPLKAGVAMVYDPRPDTPKIDWVRVYQAFFERNVQVDVVHVDEFAAGAANGYALVVSAPAERSSLASMASRTTPVVKIAGARGAVETRFLESSDVLMLIGLNHTDTRQRVTMTFPPETQEAIWQNMETGAAVNFIAGPDGPTYTYTFGAKDALVLMIRKNMR